MRPLARTLAVVCSLILALPAGWCCAAGAQACGHPRPTTAGHHCCSHAAKPGGPTAPAPPPAKPAKACTCQPPATVPPDAGEPTPEPAGCPFAGPAEPTTAAPVAGPAARTGGPPRPPLHVLHCVWRC